MHVGEVDAATFEWQMRLLKQDFCVLPLAEAVSRLKGDDLPARAVAITFDDGYADNAEIALPILQQMELTATFFVSTGFLNGGRMWNDSLIEAVRMSERDILDLEEVGLGTHTLTSFADRRRAALALIARLKHLPPDERGDRVEAVMARAGCKRLPSNLMMTHAQVRTLHRAGMEIGAHTTTHPILAMMERAGARAEIANSQAELEGIVGDRVRFFAYPNGQPGIDYRAEHAEMVRELGFQAAMSTAWGAATRASDLFQLPRFVPWDRRPLAFAARGLANYRRTRPAVA